MCPVILSNYASLKPGPAPGQPSDVSVSQSGYAIFIQWKPPILHKRFLTGYFIRFNFYGDKDETQLRVGPDESHYVLDMTADPGKLVQLRLQAEGDVEHSNATKTLFIRSGKLTLYTSFICILFSFDKTL